MKKWSSPHALFTLFCCPGPACARRTNLSRSTPTDSTPKVPPAVLTDLHWSQASAPLLPESCSDSSSPPVHLVYPSVSSRPCSPPRHSIWRTLLTSLSLSLPFLVFFFKILVSLVLSLLRWPPTGPTRLRPKRDSEKGTPFPFA